ncbi:hypothetical protein CYCD_01900 [Tenuifilaceae bacterium CYCD]|nr:hypothetical protein CYCD_01900 [Tenuifilaceae bacterium CYCD]
MRILLIISLLIIVLTGCKKNDEDNYSPIIVLKNTANYTLNEAEIPVGGKLRFGITATTGSAPLTNLRITRIVNGQRIREIDTGFFIEGVGMDTSYGFVKSLAETELWEFFVMNANRDSAITTRTILLGDGSAYGAINHYESLKIGMQSNTVYPHFVDLDNGSLYSTSNVFGHEGEIDLVGFVYLTSGVMSPTLCCPAYTGSSSVTTHYPEILDWTVRNAISYDYYSSDNDLVDPENFDNAQNDSLLVASFLPGNVSGLCKYCYTSRIIPFKTVNGKYGLVRVKYADTAQDGYMELEIKIQQ